MRNLLGQRRFLLTLVCEQRQALSPVESGSRGQREEGGGRRLRAGLQADCTHLSWLKSQATGRGSEGPD